MIWPILLLGFGFNLVLGWARWRGEWHNVRLANAQNRGDWQTVAKEARLAENLFYEYTDAALPLAWHEGTARFQLKEYPESVVAFERAYRLNPWSFQVINNYAAALVKSQRYAESVPLFEKALAINPRYDEGKFNLSFVYFHMADYTRSAEWLSHVDTIANPASDADRKKNANILKRREEFQRVLAEKQR